MSYAAAAALLVAYSPLPTTAGGGPRTASYEPRTTDRSAPTIIRQQPCANCLAPSVDDVAAGRHTGRHSRRPHEVLCANAARLRTTHANKLATNHPPARPLSTSSR